jgi:hypothetical protein
VVETMRRELHARASQLTGVPLVRGPATCSSAASASRRCRRTSIASSPPRAEDLPEFVAVADYVGAVERLDDAVQAFLSLQYSGGQPTAAAQAGGLHAAQRAARRAGRALRMFHRPTEVKPAAALMQTRLQWATRCAWARR